MYRSLSLRNGPLAGGQFNHNACVSSKVKKAISQMILSKTMCLEYPGSNPASPHCNATLNNIPLSFYLLLFFFFCFIFLFLVLSFGINSAPILQVIAGHKFEIFRRLWGSKSFPLWVMNWIHLLRSSWLKEADSSNRFSSQPTNMLQNT